MKVYELMAFTNGVFKQSFEEGLYTSLQKAKDAANQKISFWGEGSPGKWECTWKDQHWVMKLHGGVLKYTIRAREVQ